MFVSNQDYAKTARLIFTRFGGKVVHGPRKKLLDFGVNLDLDPGIFGMTFSIAVYVILAMLKSPHHGFSKSLKISRLVDLKLNELKPVLVVFASILIHLFYNLVRFHIPVFLRPSLTIQIPRLFKFL